MKEVNLYVQGMCKNDVSERPGSYVCMLEYKGHKKILSDFMEHTTANKVMLIGITNAIKLLKETCCINIYIPCSLGFKKIYRNGEYIQTKSERYNYKELNILSDLMVKKGHKHNEIVTYKYANQLKEINKSRYVHKYKMYKRLKNLRDQNNLPDIEVEETESISDSPITNIGE